jgi:hypothetical protein
MFFFLSFLFLLLQNQRIGGQNKSCPGGKAGISGREEVMGKEGRRMNTVQKMSTLACKCKIIPVQTIIGISRRVIKENSGAGEFKYDIFDTL